MEEGRLPQAPPEGARTGLMQVGAGRKEKPPMSL